MGECEHGLRSDPVNCEKFSSVCFAGPVNWAIIEGLDFAQLEFAC